MSIPVRFDQKWANTTFSGISDAYSTYITRECPTAYASYNISGVDTLVPALAKTHWSKIRVRCMRLMAYLHGRCRHILACLLKTAFHFLKAINVERHARTHEHGLYRRAKLTDQKYMNLVISIHWFIVIRMCWKFDELVHLYLVKQHRFVSGGKSAKFLGLARNSTYRGMTTELD